MTTNAPESMAVRATVLMVFLTLIASSVFTSAFAGCADPASPRVDWRRCAFEGTNLQGSNLAGARLREGLFNRSDLSSAVLDNTDSRRAKFLKADLREASIQNANLTECDFTNADLTGADLAGTNLTRVKFFGASLRGVNFTGAEVNKADFRNADLSAAIWIDGARICADNSIGQCR
jgi:uncharacterized protein YjbI with pentapeptide repeats